MKSILNLKQQITYYKNIMTDARTLKVSKVLLGVAAAYLFLPLDIIPNFIPVLGQLDDAIIIPLIIFLALLFVPKEVKEEYSNS